MQRHTPRRAKQKGRRALAAPECLELRSAPGALLLLPPLVESFANDSHDATPTAVQEDKSTRRSKPEKAARIPSLAAADLLRVTSRLAEVQLKGNSPALREPVAEDSRETSTVMGVLLPAQSTVVATLPSMNTAPPANEVAKPATLPTPPVTPVSNSASMFGASGGGANVSSGGGDAGAPPASSTPVTSAAAVAPVATVPTAPVATVISNSPAPLEAPAPAPSAIPSAAIVQTSATTAVSVAPVVIAPVVTPTPSPAPTPTPQAQTAAAVAVTASGPVIEADEVQLLLDRASAATPRNDAIIAVVDRNGQILGVRVEDGITLVRDDLVFAIDGAVAKARTAAFFANDQGPLTSRTVRFISQSTITQREVESNPNITDTSSVERGPGFVAPIGVGGHFPPGVMFTPHVDLFAIEHTNRDGIIHPGEDLIRGTADDVDLMTRFGADFASGMAIDAPESYGKVSGLLPNAQSRGIATLPGGIPLYKLDGSTPRLVGGIGVFFPGPDGYATFEQNFQPQVAGQPAQNPQDRLNAPLVLEAEYTAFAAAGGVGTIAGIPSLAGFVVPRGRIDLAGITLEIYGPHPLGEKGLVAFGQKLGAGTVNGANQPVDVTGNTLLNGESVPEGWLVSPRASASGDLTEADVRKIIMDGVAEAEKVRAAIRTIGSRTKMVLSVTDTNGEILGLFRMPDATFFSIDVAVAKARNVAYYADEDAILEIDQVDENFDGTPDVDPGVAFTNRTFRYLASPFFPTGVDGAGSGPFSILNDVGINPDTAENLGPPLPPGAYTSVLAYDAFNPGSNFHELSDPGVVVGNQNGIVFFPGSSPLYKDGKLVGGLGVSGDGVDQDDVVTFSGGGTFIPGPNSGIVRSDQTFVRGVRLPYQKFNRNPRG